MSTLETVCINHHGDYGNISAETELLNKLSKDLNYLYIKVHPIPTSIQNKTCLVERKKSVLRILVETFLLDA